MTLQELYLTLNGDYADVLNRLMKDERIRKYLVKFADSTDYDEMLKSHAAEDWETMFRCVHTLKGMALNLGLSQLASSSSDLCETVRGGAPQTDITDLLARVAQDYADTVSAIRSLD